MPGFHANTGLCAAERVASCIFIFAEIGERHCAGCCKFLDKKRGIAEGSGMKKKFLLLGTVTLALIAGLMIYISFFTVAEARLTRPLAELVPAEVPGWVSQDLPLSQSEVLSDLVSNALQFDAWLYRVYTSKEMEVTVYVAYWKPGKVSTTDAGVHNPDSCWVNSGWTREERRYGMEFQLGGRRLKPLEYGMYSIREETQGKLMRVPVVFWHLVGDEVNRYEDQPTGFRSGLKGRIDRLPLVLADLKKYGLNQRREQMFVRITLNKTLGAAAQNADFIRLMNALEPLGIFEAAGTQTGENATLSAR
jgi:hypothetical protein